MDNNIKHRNIAFNLLVITTLWKNKHGSLKENKNSKLNFYDFIEREEETIRKWLHQLLPKESIMEKWALKMDNDYGISKDYLTGKKVIDLHDKNRLNKNYDDYCKLKFDMQESPEKEKSNISNIRIITIDEDFPNRIKEEQTVVSLTEGYEKELRETTKNLLDKYTDYKSKDIELYSLLYFIHVGIKYIGGRKLPLDELTKCLLMQHTKDMQSVEKKLLEEYIDALEKQLELAKSVYVVRNDLNNWK